MYNLINAHYCVGLPRQSKLSIDAESQGIVKCVEFDCEFMACRPVDKLQSELNNQKEYMEEVGKLQAKLKELKQSKEAAFEA